MDWKRLIPPVWFTQYLAGFSLLLPTVYDWWQVDSTYVFRNDNPTPNGRRNTRARA